MLKWNINLYAGKTWTRKKIRYKLKKGNPLLSIQNDETQNGVKSGSDKTRLHIGKSWTVTVGSHSDQDVAEYGSSAHTVRYEGNDLHSTTLYDKDESHRM